MYLDYSIFKLFHLLFSAIINYKVFICIIISCIILSYIYWINRKNKIFDIVISVFNLILIVVIIKFYGHNLFSLEIFNHFNHNMYFYFLNSIVYLILTSIMLYKNIIKKTSITIYSLSLVFLLFSLFMTIYLDNIHLIILGNIYPSIVIGNLLYIVYYLILIVRKIKLCYNGIVRIKKEDKK